MLVSPLTKLDRNSGPGYAVGVPFCTERDSLCVVVSRACCPLPLPTKTVYTQPLIVTACPGGNPVSGEIRCQSIILARKDEPTPDYALARKDEPTPDYARHRITRGLRGG